MLLRSAPSSHSIDITPSPPQVLPRLRPLCLSSLSSSLSTSSSSASVAAKLLPIPSRIYISSPSCHSFICLYPTEASAEFTVSPRDRAGPNESTHSPLQLVECTNEEIRFVSDMAPVFVKCDRHSFNLRASSFEVCRRFNPMAQAHPRKIVFVLRPKDDSAPC